MRRFVIIFLGVCGAFLLATALAGCGGGSNPNAVGGPASITLAPPTVSIEPGQAVQLSVTVKDSKGTVLFNQPITFSSGATSVATVASGGNTPGLVCGGSWDSTTNPVVCTPGGTGTTTITATVGGLSATTTVYVHLHITSITLSPSSVNCDSQTATTAFTATAFNNATNITSTVGPFTWTSSDATVATIAANTSNAAVLNAATATAVNPGQTTVFATAGTTNSVPATFRTCMPKLLVLHLSTDPAGTTTTSASMSAGQTLVLKADMTDENGTLISPAPVSIVSNNPVVASMSGTTLTAVAAGGAGVVAACVPSGCGNGLNTPIYSNVFQVTVTGSSPSSTVYATSSFSPPSGTTATAIPIDTGTNVAGTAINLSGFPNSFVFSAGGTRAFLGTSGGLATLDPTNNQIVTLVPGLVAGVIAVNPAGTIALASNAANDPSTGTPLEPNAANQRLFVINQSNSTIQTLVVAGAVAGAFTSDGTKAYIAANTGKVYVFSTLFALQTLSPGGTPSSVALLASDPFAYTTGSPSLDTFAVCDNSSPASPPATSAPQLVGAVRNADVIVAVNSTGIDIATATVTPPAAGICPPGVSYTNQFIDFGLGAFTARQLLVASNGSRVVVIPAGINKILTAVPGGAATIITLPAGATEGLSGALTSDGNTLWVGVGGTNTVDRIDLTTGTVVAQVATSFKKSDSTPAPPNIVAMRPK